MFNLSGMLCLIMLIFSSCLQNKTGKDFKNRLKPVPLQYFLATDSNFSHHEDTLFYEGKKFSGHTYLLFSPQDTVFTGSYLNGLEEGVFKKWYPNKQLAETRFYIDGKKEGNHKGWWENGKPKFNYNFLSGEHQGELTEWYNSGNMFRHFNYQMGYEEGAEKMWWENGTIRANYVVKKGKKYGLIGLKICSNPFDSVIKK